jgi:hypothetical protein
MICGRLAESSQTFLLHAKSFSCCWRSCRSAHHQAGGDQELALHLQIAGVFRLQAKSLEGGARQIDARAADGGQRRQRELGEVDVV